MKIRTCLWCEEEFPKRGEAKKYCSSRCRGNAFTSRKRVEEKLILENEKILRKNRNILATLLGKDEIPTRLLVDYGFNFKLHTGRMEHEGQVVVLYHDLGFIYNKSQETIKILLADEL